MKKRYWIICAFAVLFLACVFNLPAQAKPVHEEDVKPCIVVDPWMSVSEDRNYLRNQRIDETIFVHRSGNYGFTYEGYIPKVKIVPTSSNRVTVTYHGLIPLSPGQI